MKPAPETKKISLQCYHCGLHKQGISGERCLECGFELLVYDMWPTIRDEKHLVQMMVKKMNDLGFAIGENAMIGWEFENLTDVWQHFHSMCQSHAKNSWKVWRD